MSFRWWVVDGFCTDLGVDKKPGAKQKADSFAALRNDKREELYTNPHLRGEMWAPGIFLSKAADLSKQQIENHQQQNEAEAAAA